MKNGKLLGILSIVLALCAIALVPLLVIFLGTSYSSVSGVFSVVSEILNFVGAPLGIVLGVLAIRKKHKVLGITGVILSVLAVGLVIVDYVIIIRSDIGVHLL